MPTTLADSHRWIQRLSVAVLVLDAAVMFGAGPPNARSNTRPSLPSLVTSVKPSLNVTSVAFSRDETEIASVSSDGRLLVWDTTSGLQVRTARVPGEVSAQVSFGRAKSTVYVASTAGIVRFDLTKGTMNVIVRGAFDSFALSPDGQWLATVDGSRVILHRLTGMSSSRTLSGSTDSLHQTFPKVVFNDASTELAFVTAQWASVINLKTMTWTPRRPLRGLSVDALAYSKKDGFEMAGCLWKSPEAVHCGLQVQRLRDGTVVLDDPSRRPSQSKFSLDGTQLFTFGAMGKTEQFVRLTIGHPESTLTLEERPANDHPSGAGLRLASSVFSYMIEPSLAGNRIAYMSDNYSEMVIRDLTTQQLTPLGGADLADVGQVAFAEDDQVLLEHQRNVVHAWSTNLGRPFATWTTSGQFAISKSSHLLAAPLDRSRIRLVDLTTLAETQMDGFTNADDVVAIGDGKDPALLWSEREFVTQFHLRRSGQLPADSEVLCTTDMAPIHSSGHSGDFFALFCSPPQGAPILLVGNLSTSKRQRFPATIDVLAVDISSDGRFLATLMRDGAVELTETQSRLKTHIPPPNGASFSSLGFDVRGDLVLGLSDGTVGMWLGGRLSNAQRIHLSSVSALSVAKTGYTLSGSYDGQLGLYNPRTTEILVRMVTIPDGSWLVANSSGLFDGTADALRWANWQESLSQPMIPLDTFFEDFYSPGLLAAAWTGTLPAPPKGASLAEKIRVPGFQNLLGSGTVRIAEENGELKLCLKDRPTSDLLDNLGLTFQGQPQAVSDKNVNFAESSVCRYYVKLPGKQQDYELVNRRSSSAPGRVAPNPPGRRTDLRNATVHIQTIAINKYPKVPELELHYAISDAQKFENYFTKMSEKLNADSSPDQTKIRIWQALTDDRATVATIRARIEQISNESSPNDVVVIFLTGHGSVPPGVEMFYYLTADTTGVSADEVRKGGLSTLMLADALRTMNAKRVVIILDACLSGGSLDSLQKVASAKIKSEETKLQATHGIVDNVGVHIFAAATPLQDAIELNRLGYGIFGQSLVELLNGPPLSMHEIGEQLPARVQALSSGLSMVQTPVFVSIGTDFSLNAIGGNLGVPLIEK